MDPNNRCFRMAILNADTSIPNVYANMGTFGDILHRVLAQAAWKVDGNATIEHSVFDIVRGEYPGSLFDFDAVLITASAASSYDPNPWIQELEKYIIRLHRNHPDVKIFGSCFGHHLVCQALLKDHGLRVEKSPKGWEIGVNHVALTDDFRTAYAASIKKECTRWSVRSAGRLPSPDEDGSDLYGVISANSSALFAVPETVRLQFVHEDQVIMPSLSTCLPRPWILLGSTEHCAVQGVYQPGRVLTLQGHFEFDKFESRQTERIFGADIDSVADRMNGSCGLKGDMMDEMDDGYLVAEMVVRFLLGASEKDDISGLERQNILPTPRSSMETF